MQSEDGDKRENVFCCVKIHDIYGGGTFIMDFTV